MSIGPVLPTALGALSVGVLSFFAVFEAMRSLPLIADWVRSAMKPLRRAGDEGYLPDSGERLRLAFMATLLVLTVAVLVAGIGPAMLLAAAGPSAAFALIRRRRTAYRQRVERTVPDLAAAIADALAGGASLRRALIEAGQSLQGPAAAEFERIRVDLGLGVTPRDSLKGLATRVRSERIDALVTLLTTVSDSGGDLVLLLRRFGAADRSRQTALRDAGSATAQARYTGMLVVALPGGAALFAELVRPGFFASIFRDPASAMLLVLAVLLQSLGLFVVRRIARSTER